MVGHYDEARATCFQSFEDLIQHPENDSLGMVMVEKSAPTIDREGDEVDIGLIVDNSSFARHPVIFAGQS